ncbi:MAG: hypothetical protein QME82_00230 [Bacillota bacterium]|jgi:hypothetical protein|nr:hypothetical protein [Bacillota bacterium]
MRSGVLLTTMPVPVAVAVYTASFGLWLLRHRNIRGAIGVFFLAACCIAVPLLLLFVGG